MYGFGAVTGPVSLPPGIAPISTAPIPLHFGQSIPSLDPLSWKTQIYIASGLSVPLWSVAGVALFGLWFLLGGRR
jgi:hypothetical protein